MKRLTSAALAVTLTWLSLGAQAAEEAVFTDFQGQPSSIESYAGNGKWLVVMIWAHDCPICNQEAPSYAMFHEAHKDKDATVLGVSIDGEAHKADAEEFIKRHELPFPNIIAEPQPAMLYYMMHTQSQFRGTPTIMVYNPNGELVAAQAGAVPTDIIEDFIAKQAQAEPATSADEQGAQPAGATGG